MEERFSNEKFVQMLSKLVNTSVFTVHFLMLLEFTYFQVTFLSVVNFISLLMYTICFGLIYRNKYTAYIWVTYVEMSLYMCIATACLGWDYGFYLYCIGLIVVIFYADYMAIKMHRKRYSGFYFSFMLVAAYLFCFICTRVHEPLYYIDKHIANLHLALNSAIVIVFLVVYIKIVLRAVLHSENLLKSMAHHDELTGLHNRYHMLDYLQNVITARNAEEYFLMIIDIDNFKKFNDTYGHNCGDYVLKRLAELLLEKCEDYSVCRWGGEEFLIVGQIDNNMNNQVQILEDLRKSIASEDFQYSTYRLKITITGGVAKFHRSFKDIQSWVDMADKKLYQGKNSGKNKIVA